MNCMVFRGEELYPEFIDYTQVPDRLREELAEAGITQSSMQRVEGRDRVFSEWSSELYKSLEQVIADEWKKYSEGQLKRVVSWDLHHKQKQGLVSVDQAVEAEVADYDDEAATFSERKIEQAGLSTRDALRCFEDKTRTLLFLDTIRDKIQGGDRVLESGTGTGVLAIAAARAGAAKVEAIEINAVTAVFARRVVRRCEELGLIEPGRVTIRLGDALKYRPEQDSEPFNALIGENLYTGQFNELQVQMNDHLLRFVARRDNKIIPQGLVNGVELTEMPAEIRKKIRGRTDFVVKDLVNPAIPKSVTQPEAYDYLDLRKEQAIGVRNRVVKTIAKDGSIDTVTIFSLVQMSGKKEDLLYRNESDFLGNDHAIVLERQLVVKKGDQIEVFISYKAGDRASQAEVRVKNLRTGEEVRNVKENVPPQMQSIAA